jgi:hypothetical protein
MDKNVATLITVAFVIFLAGFGFWAYQIYKSSTGLNANIPAPAQNTPDPKNSTYSIEGQPVTLVNGLSEVPAAPGSASKTVTRYFGNEVSGDFNADGKNDMAFILTKNSGGSGTFYYVAAAISEISGYRGTEAILLGDRIAPQSTEYRNNEIIVNYADRAPGEPLAATPSVGMSRYFLIANGQLQEVVGIMPETEARTIAEKTCVKGGETLSQGIYNENSKTWWFDANLNATRPGCNPACVVKAETKTAEINWRCTGTIPPDNANGTTTSCTMEAKICPDGSAAGRTGPNCEFTPCPATNNGQIACTAESRLGDVCNQIYDPVCATVQIQCIKAPCNPIQQTFSNACEACHSQLVLGYLKGECVK